MKKNWILCASIVAAGWLSTPAFSAVNFSLDTTVGSNVGDTTNPLPWGNTRNFSDSGVSATASAWGGTGGVGGANTQTIEGAYLAVYGGGLGATNKDGFNGGTGTDANESLGSSPEHAIDNNGRYEAVLFDFGTDKVALDSLKLGYVRTDSDLFVLAWSGTGGPVMGSGVSASFGSIGADVANGGDGWTIVANISNAGTATQSFNTTNPLFSSFWLIGAGGFDNSGANIGNGSSSKDYVKLASVGGAKMNGGTGGGGGSAPEPGSLALAGIALLGMMGVRRRKAAA